MAEFQTDKHDANLKLPSSKKTPTCTAAFPSAGTGHYNKRKRRKLCIRLLFNSKKTRISLQKR